MVLKLGKSTVVLLIILLLGLTAAALSCSSEPGPKDTVRQMFDATEAGDWQKAASYMTGVMEQPEWLIEQQQSIIESVDINNLKLSVMSESENDATLKAEYDIEIRGAVFSDFTIEQHNTQTVKLVRVEDRWLITEIVRFDQ